MKTFKRFSVSTAQSFYYLCVKALEIWKNQGVGMLLRKVRAKTGYNIPLFNRLLQLAGLSGHVPGIEITEAYVKSSISLDDTISVVIPTRNAGIEFDEVLSGIMKQRGVKEPELIILDSGSNDGTVVMAQKYGARIVPIDQGTFNHGETRNKGVQVAGGDYILFLTQDALLANDDAMLRMVSCLKGKDDIAAVSCRQIPRADADFFFAWAMDSHYQTLGRDQDKDVVVFSDKFDELSPWDKRFIANLDNVCTLYRGDVLRRFLFKRLDFAEDLEVGIRFVKNGYRLAFLSSCAVIHSHNRSPFYWLKKSYVDSKSLHEMLECSPTCSPVMLDQLIGNIVSLYERINYAVSRFYAEGKEESFIKNLEDSKIEKESFTKDYELQRFIALMGTMSAKKTYKMDYRFFEYFKFQTVSFLVFLRNTCVPIDAENKDDFAESIYKSFATSVGRFLAACFHHSEDRDKRVITIDSMLGKEGG